MDAEGCGTGETGWRQFAKGVETMLDHDDDEMLPCTISNMVGEEICAAKCYFWRYGIRDPDKDPREWGGYLSGVPTESSMKVLIPNLALKIAGCMEATIQIVESKPVADGANVFRFVGSGPPPILLKSP